MIFYANRKESSGINLWLFSIAFDGEASKGDPYIYVRVRDCVRSNKTNIYILAITMKKRHTGEVIHQTVSSALN